MRNMGMVCNIALNCVKMYRIPNRRVGFGFMRVCIVEDEQDLNQLMAFYLEREGYTVISCGGFAQAQSWLNSDVSLWVVDIMLPDGNGLDIVRELKARDNAPAVIIISAKGDRFDRVTGFELGCDDYIAKPFLPAELVFRVNKIFQQKPVGETQNSNLLPLGPYQMDVSRRLILDGGEKAEITSREFDILLFFLKHKGQAVSREQLLQGAWSDEYFGNDRIVDNYVKNIRRKLPKLLIETVYGYGYRYNQ